MPAPDNQDSQALLNQIVLEYMHEKKRKRRWRWVIRILILLVFLVILYRLFTFDAESKTLHTKPHVGLIELKGAIFESQSGSADNFVKGLARAYKNSGLKAVIVRINSPGGSPVQADYMYNSLQYYRKKYPAIKIYAVCADICASAAYYVAAGADEIYANPSSMVGSIGVVYNGFGFVDGMQKLGISRRLQTAGINKAFLDPFSPLIPAHEKFLQSMLDDVHQQFIKQVKAGRGDRLKIDDQTFSGLLWTGQQAKERGLIDGFASSGQIAREVVKVEQMIDYTHKQSMFDRLTKSLGTAIADQLPKALGLEQGIRT